MDADSPAANRKIERDGSPKPAPRAGHEHGPGFLDLSHVVLLGEFRRLESQSDFWVPKATLGEPPSPNKGERDGLNTQSEANHPNQ